MYYLQKNIHGDVVSVGQVGCGNAIPLDPNNTDYQVYLAWLDAGNTPLPADEVTL